MSWTTGYSLPSPSKSDDWNAFRTAFEWDIPDAYNIATAVLSDEERADDTAIRHVTANGRTHSFEYGELDRATTAFAAHLSSRGIGRGDRIGVCLPQCPEHVVVHLSAYRLGAVVVPLSMILGEDSLKYSLEHSGGTALVIDRDRCDELAPSVTADVETVLPVEPSGYDSVFGGLREYVDPEATIRRAETSPDDPALVLYTSGTSGKPKGVLAGHRYLLGSLPAYHCYFHLFTSDRMRRTRVWSPSEWAWAGALFDVVFPTLSLGGTVISRERRSRFDPHRAIDLIERQRVTHAFFPPTALGRIRTNASLDDRDLSSLDVIMCGGEKLPPSVYRWATRTLGVTVNESYGQTEANGLIGNCQSVFDAEAGSMGRPYPGHEISVVDENGEVVSPNERGELAVRVPDPSFFLEYLNRPEETAEKFDGFGWFLTGDLARMDEDGRLWHAGRADDLIITSGYRVSPLEVERVLADDRSVADAVVGSVPDDDRGKRIKAYLVLANDAEPTDTKRRLQKRVRSELGAHKVPREFEFVRMLPETRSGKADRSTLFSEV
ncbi:acyl-CoA synthetase [Haladaptatus sp. CMAA 1911]|uniref:acyl-CoA synthetase n=1 Tax=unclassified Haladaptatus TaxID=2622732 RepID=UPI0037550B9B